MFNLITVAKKRVTLTLRKINDSISESMLHLQFLAQTK